MLKNKNFTISFIITLLFIISSYIYYFYITKEYNVDGFSHKATHFFKNENYFQAIKYYRKIISMGTQNERTFINTAISLIRIGYYNKAIEILLQMEKNQFISSDMYFLLAYSYYSEISIQKEQKDDKKISIPIKYLEKSLILDSRNKDSYKLLGTIYETSTKFEDARKWYKKALFEDIDNACEFYGLIANTYFKEKKFEDATTYYKKAINTNKNYISAYCDIAKIYTIQNKYSEAEEYYKQAIKINNEYIYPYFEIGNIYFILLDFPKAIEWYNQALSIEPNAAPVNYKIGIAYKNLNMLNEAIEHLKTAAYCGSDEAVKELRTILDTF